MGCAALYRGALLAGRGVAGVSGNGDIAGHAGYPDTIFSALPAVEAGDEIVIYVGERQHRYIVNEILTLLPTASWVMLPTSRETLTLITCVPPWGFTHRLVVRAFPA